MPGRDGTAGAALCAYTGWVVRHPLVVLGVTAILTGFVVAQIRHLSIGMHLDDLLPQSHPNVAIYREIRKVFGVEKTALVAVRGPGGDVFAPEPLRALAALTRALVLVARPRFLGAVRAAADPVMAVDPGADPTCARSS